MTEQDSRDAALRVIAGWPERLLAFTRDLSSLIEAADTLGDYPGAEHVAIAAENIEVNSLLSAIARMGAAGGDVGAFLYRWYHAEARTSRREAESDILRVTGGPEDAERLRAYRQYAASIGVDLSRDWDKPMPVPRE